MRTATVLTLALGTTALVAPLPHAAFAQQATFEGSCGELNTLVEDAGGEINEEFADALEIAGANDTDECTAYIVRVEEAGGLAVAGTPAETEATETETDATTETKSFSASDTLTQSVEITQEAIVDGEVIVRIPVPDIGVEQAGAEIDIQEAPATVTVDQAPASIMVRQPPMNIALDMPQPTITIEQPAPEITITMPAPGVEVGSGQPQVSVMMPDPTVSVTQAEPEVDVQVEARLVDPDDPATAEGDVVTRVEPGTGTDPDSPTANVQVTKADPVVRLIESEEQAQVSVNQAEPQVQFESSDPQVSVNMSGEPVVEVLQAGEPQIIFEQDEAAAAPEQPAEEQATAAVPVVEEAPEAEADTAAVEAPAVEEPLAEEAADGSPVVPEEPREPLSAEESAALLATPGDAQDTEVMTVMAGDLEGRDVVGANGEEIGEVSSVATSGDRMYLIVAHGGFLGIGGNEVALPMERIALMGDQVMLLGLNEEDLEAMPEYDFEQDAEIGLDQTLEINNVRQ